MGGLYCMKACVLLNQVLKTCIDIFESVNN